MKIKMMVLSAFAVLVISSVAVASAEEGNLLGGVTLKDQGKKEAPKQTKASVVPGVADGGRAQAPKADNGEAASAQLEVGEAEKQKAGSAPLKPEATIEPEPKDAVVVETPKAGSTNPGKAASVEPRAKPAPESKPLTQPSAAAELAIAGTPMPSEGPVEVTEAVVLVPPVDVPASSPAEGRKIAKVRLSDREIAFQNQEGALLREIRILNLQAQAAELRRKVAEGSAPAIELPNVNDMGPLKSVLDIPEEPPVRLISVWGKSDVLTADVLLKGRRISIKKGDALDGGWKVADIGPSSIVIARGNKTTLIKLGG